MLESRTRALDPKASYSTPSRKLLCNDYQVRLPQCVSRFFDAGGGVVTIIVWTFVILIRGLYKLLFAFYLLSNVNKGAHIYPFKKGE